MTYESLASPSPPAFVLLKALLIFLIIFVIAVTGILMTKVFRRKLRL